MRDKNVFAFSRALPRMSWSPQNLYNLWQRCFTGKLSDSQFERTAKTLFQQRWISKRLVRAYHGDHINEKIFKKWYLPSTLPEVIPKKSAKHDDTSTLAKWARRQDDVDRIEKLRQEENNTALAPVGSLMFAEVERRIDVFVFRCCFAHSVYEARRLVIHGNVHLNGVLHTNANTRLAPGDMVSVDPSAIRFLQYPESWKKNEDMGSTSQSETATTNKESVPLNGQESQEIPVSEASELSLSSNSELQTNADADASSVKNEAPQSKSEIPPGQPWLYNKSLTPFVLPDYAAPFIFIPAYIEPSFSTCSAVYVRHPTARPGYSEIPTPYDADGEVVRLAWEWYAKRRPRMRSRRQLAQMPEDRQKL
ncbi:hypothetical protein Clacol_006577 [Clathrus columnatus]|uniref:RNA-binding S4 domain-containing protein n=1 Tax=Clathrus columnatus TaxID=1419009 RepID=A0AAV5AIM8_9AGAM|nr:hypothetical protein Clacol_006577 [Clathrus columnatus]